jgi:DNA-directed RNA polymerase alpha subunit
MNTIKEFMTADIAVLGLPEGVNSCLNNIKINRVQNLTFKTKDELIKTGKVNEKSIEVIEEMLSKNGLKWHMLNKDWLDWGVEHIELIKSTKS